MNWILIDKYITWMKKKIQTRLEYKPPGSHSLSVIFRRVAGSFEFWRHRNFLGTVQRSCSNATIAHSSISDWDGYMNDFPLQARPVINLFCLLHLIMLFAHALYRRSLCAHVWQAELSSWMISLKHNDQSTCSLRTTYNTTMLDIQAIESLRKPSLVTIVPVHDWSHNNRSSSDPHLTDYLLLVNPILTAKHGKHMLFFIQSIFQS